MTSIFTKIVNRELPADIVYETDSVLAFRDIDPRAPQHILVIPKREIVSLADLTPEDEQVMGQCVVAASAIARQEGFAESGYRLIVNCGKDGGQDVPHIHFHLLAGRKLSWPPG
ncbi:MAG: histidine triad nucleotide-binding protein [Planctomycetota bacterium]